MHEHSFEVGTYDLDLTPTAGGATRSIRLQDAAADDRESVAFLNFYPADRGEQDAELGLSETVTSVEVHAADPEYDAVYHLLQTEKPVYFYATYEAGDDPIHPVGSWGLATDLEMVGEGFEDLTP